MEGHVNFSLNILDTVRQSLPSKAVTDDEMEAVIKEYLKAAAKRLKKNHCADMYVNTITKSR